MPIQLDGWENAIDNIVYRNQMLLDGTTNPNLTSYLLISKYRESTEREVLDYICKEAKTVPSFDIKLPRGVGIKISDTAKLLAKSSKKLVEDLSAGSLEAREFMSHYVICDDVT